MLNRDSESRAQHRNAIIIQDLFSYVIQSYPVKNDGLVDTAIHPQGRHFVGVHGLCRTGFGLTAPRHLIAFRALQCARSATALVQSGLSEMVDGGNGMLPPSWEHLRYYGGWQDGVPKANQCFFSEVL